MLLFNINIYLYTLSYAPLHGLTSMYIMAEANGLSGFQIRYMKQGGKIVGGKGVI